MKNIIILLEYIKINSTSNDFIQVVYMGLNEARKFGDEYFTKRSILIAQNYDVDNVNKHAIKRILGFSHNYFNVDIEL